MQKETEQVIEMAIEVLVTAVFMIMVGWMLLRGRDAYVMRYNYMDRMDEAYNINTVSRYVQENFEISVSDIIDFISKYGEKYDYIVFKNGTAVSNLPKAEIPKRSSINASAITNYQNIGSLKISDLSYRLYADNQFVVEDRFYGELMGPEGKLDVRSLDAATTFVFYCK